MINIEGKNRLHDVYRLLWYIIPLIASFVLGFLVSFYVDENNIFQGNTVITLTCPDPIVTLNSIIPTGWAE